MPKRMSERKFSAGKAVEVSLHAEDSLDTWYPATVIKETGKGSFVVEYKKSDEGGLVQVVVDSHHIRPSPPTCVSTTFQLLEKVDAFCNFGWSSGVVTKVLAEGRYIVYFKRTRKEKELRHTDLRLPMVQIHGKWVPSSQDAAPAAISNSRESKGNNLVGNGKISLPPENPGIVKKSEEVRNGEKEQAKTVSSTKNEGDTKNKALHDRATRKKLRRDKTFKELKAKPAPEELQSSHQVRETQMTQAERSDPGIVRESEEARNDQKEQAITVSSPGIEEDNKPLHDRMTKKKPRRDRTVKDLNTESTPKESQSSLQEVLEEKVDLPTSKRAPFRGRRERGRGRAQGSGPRIERASVAGAAANQLPITFAESFQGYIGKPIVISLPCYNSKWNKLQGQGTTKLPIHNATEGQDEEKQLPSHVSDGSNETKGVNNENSTTPRRKRGRPFGSFSAPGKKRVKEADEVVVTIVSTSSGIRRKSTRERREVHKSAIDTLRPRSKKLRRVSEDSSPTQEMEADLNEKAEAVVTYSLGFVDPVSNQPIPDELISQGIYVNLTDIDEEDDDRPLSTWFGEAHSLPNYSKPSSGGNTSQSGKPVAKIEQRLIVYRKEDTAGGSDVNLAQSASQDEGGTGWGRGEKVTDLVLKGLPFSKISPIWKVIESMEVFQQIPQNPHFQPLYDIKEHCREGLAICSMVTFSRLAEDIFKFQFDDPSNILEDSMETLSDLERQGFNVESISSRLRALLSIKSGHGQAQSIEKEIAEEQKERAKIDEEIDDLDRKMAELREKLALHEREREKKDSKIGELQSRFDPVKDALAAARSEFERLASAPW